MRALLFGPRDRFFAEIGPRERDTEKNMHYLCPNQNIVEEGDFGALTCVFNQEHDINDRSA